MNQSDTLAAMKLSRWAAGHPVKVTPSAADEWTLSTLRESERAAWWEQRAIGLVGQSWRARVLGRTDYPLSTAWLAWEDLGGPTYVARAKRLLEAERAVAEFAAWRE